MSLKLFKKSLAESLVINKNGYQYMINPLTDGIPSLDPSLLNEVACEMYKHIKKTGNFDKIVTLEAMGIHLASLLSLKTNKPFTIIRKKQYNLPGEITINQVTGYSKSKLYLNGFKKDENIIIIDDILSTGGSVKSVLSAFKKIGVNVKGIFVAVDKGNASAEIKKEYKIDIKALASIDIINGKVVIKNL